MALLVIATLSAPCTAHAQAVRPSPTPPASARFVLDNLSRLAAGQSLAEWRRARAAGRVEPLLTEHDDDYGPWCAKVVDETPFDDTVLRRSAYFYAPSLSASSTLPNASSAALRNQCRLGLLETVVEFRDEQRAEALGTQVRRALDAILGKRVNDTPLWGGAANWRNSGWWITGEASVVTAVAPTDYTGRPSPLQVLVLAAGPARGVGFDLAPPWWSGKLQYNFERERLTSRILDALALAAIGGTTEGEIRSLLSTIGLNRPEIKRDPQGTPSDPTAALERWLTVTAALPASRRAAALLVADVVLARTAGPWGTEGGASSRRRLGRHGATFQQGQSGDGFSYGRDWLKMAVRLAPQSQAGELAFITLLEMGFETSTCDAPNGEGFRAVIREGTNFLATHPAALTRAYVELLVGLAYADIVALAHGAESDYTRPRVYQREEAAARARAVEHLRAGLGGDIDATEAAEARNTMWRLLAGLAPWNTTFFYTCD
ncbi:MAG: hypothetical protein QM736_21755 [Vicinamibacterales bacterium]